MTPAPPSFSLHSIAPALLQAWHSEASAQLGYLEAAVIAPRGAAWQVMLCALELLDAQREPQTTPFASSSPTLSAQISPLARLRAQAQPCAEKLAALPIAWRDTRLLLTLLGTHARRVLLQHNADAGQILFCEAALESLAAAAADLRVPQLEEQVTAHEHQTIVTEHLAERFLGNASHELRTPLTAILGFADLLLEGNYGELTPEQRTALEHIENSAQNLNESISNMLDLLRIRGGNLNLQYRTTKLRDMLQHLYSILTPLATRKNVRFLLEAPEDLGTAEVDENIVRHIVYHLLASALRATPAGGEVILRAWRKDHTLTIETGDTALHLPPEAVANMLSPFPRLENLPTRGYEGWEVGLPLVRRYVELHHGDMTLENLPDKGTVFTITLPLTRQAAGSRTP